MADPRFSETAADRGLDDALKAATLAKPAPPVGETPLKKLWDDSLEAELEAALAGFDASKMVVDSPRGRSGERARPRASVGARSRGGPARGTARSSASAARASSSTSAPRAKGSSRSISSRGSFPSRATRSRSSSTGSTPTKGCCILSLKGAAVEANWENLRKGLIVEARVTKTNKGGLEVEVGGIRGFLPIGQIEIGRVEDAAIYINQKLRVS